MYDSSLTKIASSNFSLFQSSSNNNRLQLFICLNSAVQVHKKVDSSEIFFIIPI